MLSDTELKAYRESLSEDDRKAFDIVRKFFRNDRNEPFEMTLGQIGLFRAIYEKQSQRIQFECYTQYGKSDVVSMAVLLRVATFPDKYIILGGSKEKAQIIMRKIIKHIFENEYTSAKFEVGGESIERIKRERSKDRLTFRVDDKGAMGEVMILSADARRKGDDAGDILIGHGCPNLIEDDAALIPDNIHTKALRMLGGFPDDNFLLKITNSFGRNHAFKSLSDPAYQVHIITGEQGVEEGRITQQFLDEMRRVSDPIMYGILYDCKHPPAEMIDDEGWMPMISEEEILNAQERGKTVEAYGHKHLGGDIAEGINYNACVIRQDNYARVKRKWQNPDLMGTAEDFKEIIIEERINPRKCFFDAIGIGAGITSRLDQILSLKVNPIKVGNKPTEKSELELRKDPNEFANLRAEVVWKSIQWIKQGGGLCEHPDWLTLTKLRYRTITGKKIEVMSKKDMRLGGLLEASESPDVPDAFSLTFAPKKKIMMTGQATEGVKPFYPDLGF